MRSWFDVPMMCTREFLCGGEGFHVEEENDFIMNWFIKRGSHTSDLIEGHGGMVLLVHKPSGAHQRNARVDN